MISRGHRLRNRGFSGRKEARDAVRASKVKRKMSKEPREV